MSSNSVRPDQGRQNLTDLPSLKPIRRPMLGKSQGIIMDSPPTAISLRRICRKYQQNTDADAESLEAKTSLHT